MSFCASWDKLLENVKELPSNATLLTPLSRKPFGVKDIQEDRVLVEYRNGGETIPLQREQFETLSQRIEESRGSFGLDRLPPNAEPYATVLSIHPRFELDDQEGILTESEIPTNSPLVEAHDIGQQEVEEQEQRTDDLTSFKSGASSQSEQSTGDTEVSIDEMMENMSDSEKDIECPIEGCHYKHRSAASVARHVSGSSTAKHIWENTLYAGWRDFVRKHEEPPT